MAKKFKNKYRIDSMRMKGYDYGQNGGYFITICTDNRRHFFGEVVDGDMILNPPGELAQRYWLEIVEQFSFTRLGEFIIMPNHMHGILIIDHGGGKIGERDAINRVSTNISPTNDSPPLPNDPEDPPLNTPGGITGNHNPMLHRNMGRVVRWYKGRCTFEIHKINPDFKWQSRFHDSIIFNERSFQRITNYIRNNPKNWKEGGFH